jgi:hypothetical protein
MNQRFTRLKPSSSGSRGSSKRAVPESSAGIAFFFSPAIQVPALPNKAPEPTPGSVTPRATEGTSK